MHSEAKQQNTNRHKTSVELPQSHLITDTLSQEHPGQLGLIKIKKK